MLAPKIALDTGSRERPYSVAANSTLSRDLATIASVLHRLTRGSAVGEARRESIPSFRERASPSCLLVARSRRSLPVAIGEAPPPLSRCRARRPCRALQARALSGPASVPALWPSAARASPLGRSRSPRVRFRPEYSARAGRALSRATRAFIATPGPRLAPSQCSKGGRGGKGGRSRDGRSPGGAPAGRRRSRMADVVPRHLRC